LTRQCLSDTLSNTEILFSFPGKQCLQEKMTWNTSIRSSIDAQPFALNLRQHHSSLVSVHAPVTRCILTRFGAHRELLVTETESSCDVPDSPCFMTEFHSVPIWRATKPRFMIVTFTPKPTGHFVDAVANSEISRHPLTPSSSNNVASGRLWRAPHREGIDGAPTPRLSHQQPRYHCK
jgi:hypothetical protein